MNQKNKRETKRKTKEGLHYYIENGFRVFTELYHGERGFCCGQGCRHCPFEPKHQGVRENFKKD